MAGIVQPRQPASREMQRVYHTHPSNGAVIPTAQAHTQRPRHLSTGHASQLTAVPKAFMQCTVQIIMTVCVCVLKKQEIKKAQKDAPTQQEAQLDGSDTCGTPPTSTITHGGSIQTSTQKTKQNLKIHGGRVWLCVCGAAGVCQPWQQKNKTRGKEMCAPPHRHSSHAHTSRLPQRA
ncbi:hypothetical protein TcCL_Unassigned00226, partial [Trypanosoma cruzi]